LQWNNYRPGAVTTLLKVAISCICIFMASMYCNIYAVQTRALHARDPLAPPLRLWTSAGSASFYFKLLVLFVHVPPGLDYWTNAPEALSLVFDERRVDIFGVVVFAKLIFLISWGR